jgi:hypothetical protein
LGVAESLDLALVIERKHHRVSRRIDIEPDDVDELVAKLGSPERLNAQAVRLQLVRPQDGPQRIERNADAWAVARPVHWIAWCGGSAQVSATTRAVVSAASGAMPDLRVLSRS